MSLRESEFTVLRQTIATRGTARVVVAFTAILAWAALTLAMMLLSELPVAALLSLAVLAAGFEAVHALHVGVERIGRYIQVEYEAADGGPRWETAAMRVGPALPGGGVDPLFSVLFLCAAVLNVIAALLPAPTPIEIGVIGLMHVVFGIRVLRARLAAASQREVELARFNAQRPSTNAQ